MSSQRKIYLYIANVKRPSHTCLHGQTNTVAIFSSAISIADEIDVLSVQVTINATYSRIGATRACAAPAWVFEIVNFKA